MIWYSITAITAPVTFVQQQYWIFCLIWFQYAEDNVVFVGAHLPDILVKLNLDFSLLMLQKRQSGLQVLAGLWHLQMKFGLSPGIRKYNF